MSEQTSAVPPPLPNGGNDSKAVAAAPRKKWPWWQKLLLIVAGAAFLIKIVASYHPIALEVRIFRDGSVSATNTGDGPITINDILVNDQRDCRQKLPEPRVLKIGEQIGLNSMCNIVRVKFDTDKGSETYNFNR